MKYIFRSMWLLSLCFLFKLHAYVYQECRGRWEPRGTTDFGEGITLFSALPECDQTGWWPLGLKPTLPGEDSRAAKVAHWQVTRPGLPHSLAEQAWKGLSWGI